MSWQDNGRDGDKDPWNRKGDEPPDLEQWLKDIKKKLERWLGANKKGFPGFGGEPNPGVTRGLLQKAGWGASVVLALYVLSGIYIVEPAEQAVITRFGRYVRMAGAGPHWYPRLIERVKIVNVEQMHTIMPRGSMLTKDENIVEVEIAVQYYIGDASQYLFNIVDPHGSLGQVSESALRYVIGHSTLEEVLTSGRTAIAMKIRKQIEENLSSYKSGWVVADVAMQPARAPEPVKSAFDDAIRAQEDEVRFENQAEAYVQRVTQIAEGKAQRLREEAEAYKQKQILLAKGESERFELMLPQYQKSKRLMRDRLYLETVQQILSNTSKVLIDSNSGQNLIYLPLDKLVNATTVGSEKLNVAPMTERKMHADEVEATRVATEQSQEEPSGEVMRPKRTRSKGEAS